MCAPIVVLTSKETVESIQRVVLPEVEKGGVMEYIQLWAIIIPELRETI
jgi:hypothetical protein